MRARYYSSDMRRFVNADILAGEISEASTTAGTIIAPGVGTFAGLVVGLFVSDVCDLLFDWGREKYINPIVENN